MVFEQLLEWSEIDLANNVAFTQITEKLYPP